MGSTRRSYTPEYKAHSVAFVIDGGRPPSKREKDDSVLTVIMRKVHAEARGNPGVRRMRSGLAVLGHLVSHKRVHRLMQAAGLRGRHPRAWKRTTIGGDKPVPAPDLIGRDFTAALPI
jgi:putative transposase